MNSALFSMLTLARCIDKVSQSNLELQMLIDHNVDPHEFSCMEDAIAETVQLIDNVLSARVSELPNVESTTE